MVDEDEYYLDDFAPDDWRDADDPKPSKPVEIIKRHENADYLIVMEFLHGYFRVVVTNIKTGEVPEISAWGGEAAADRKFRRARKEFCEYVPTADEIYASNPKFGMF